MAGLKFGEFGESSTICQTKIIQISSNLLFDLNFICQNFFASQTLLPPLYSMSCTSMVTLPQYHLDVFAVTLEEDLYNGLYDIKETK